MSTAMRRVLSLLDNWIDEAERRTWFLYEATRRDPEGDDV